MLKRIALLTGVGLMVGVMGAQAYADDGPRQPKNQYKRQVRERWTRANVGHLFLFEKVKVPRIILDKASVSLL